MVRPAWTGKMFFMARVIFWLGLTFSAMDWPADNSTGQAATELASKGATKVTRLCVENPRACLSAAQAIDQAGKSRERRANARSKHSKPIADTLEAPDRAPAWRGRS